MSLININHFVAPFRSKLQIGSVVVLAVLVAVVRFTGMQASSSDDSSRFSTTQDSMRGTVQRGEDVAEDDIGQFVKSNTRSRQALKARQDPTGDEAVDELIKGGPVTGRRPPPSSADEGTQPGRLNEVLRSIDNAQR